MAVGGALFEVCIVAVFALIGAFIAVRFFCLLMDRAMYFWQFLAAIAFYGLALMIFVATNIVPHLGMINQSARIPSHPFLKLVGWVVMLAALFAGMAWHRYLDRCGAESRAERVVEQVRAAIADFSKREFGYADHLALADMYVRSGKRQEAWQLLERAARIGGGSLVEARL